MQCNARAEHTGVQCLRNATHGSFCWQHQDNEPEHSVKPSGSWKLYLIDTEDDRVIAGPATDRKYLLNIAETEVENGVPPEHLRIVATTHYVEIASVNLTLTEA